MASGREDFWGGTIPGRTLLPDSYSTVNIALDALLLAETDSGIIDVYAVPAGRACYISSADLSASISGVNRFELYEDAVLRLSTLFDMHYQLVDSDVGIIPKPAGAVIKVKIFNYADENVRFTGAIWGTLVPV